MLDPRPRARAAWPPGNFFPRALALLLPPHVARPPAALPVWRGSHFSRAPAGIRQARQGARSGPATRAAGSRRPGATPARAWARTGRLQSQAVVAVVAAVARVAGCLVEVRGRGPAAHPLSRPGGRRAGHPWARGPPGREVAAPDAGPRSDRGLRGSHLAVGYWKKRGGERTVAERRQEKRETESRATPAPQDPGGARR